MELLIATRNPDKLTEIREIFHVPGLECISALDVPDLDDVEEDGETLEANAEKKARECSLQTGLWSVADDTGLEVAALEGAPGVYSARYAGPEAGYEENIRKLIQEMEGKADRSARFRTVVALSSPKGETLTVDGECTGDILETPRGHGGFGYDPVFQPSDYRETFAELSADEKHRISHRGRAFRAAREAWPDLLRRIAEG